MVTSQEDVQRVLREYVTDDLELTEQTATRLVSLAVSAVHEVTARGKLYPPKAKAAFPELLSLARIYSWLDPTVQIIHPADGFNSLEKLRFRDFLDWLTAKVEAKDYGYQTKEKLLHALKESEGYRIAFHWEFEVEKQPTNDDDDYVDEDRCEADYADEYVRNA